MNENNEIITMEDEKVASILQKMKKSSRWLSGFLESYRPPLDGEVYLTETFQITSDQKQERTAVIRLSVLACVCSVLSNVLLWLSAQTAYRYPSALWRTLSVKATNGTHGYNRYSGGTLSV